MSSISIKDICKFTISPKYNFVINLVNDVTIYDGLKFSLIEKRKKNREIRRYKLLVLYNNKSICLF